MSALSVSPLKLSERRATDVLFGVLYVVLALATFGILIHSSTAAGQKGTWDALENCSMAPSAPPSSPSPPQSSHVAADLIGNLYFLAVPVFGAVALGCLWMALLRYYAKPMVYATLVFKGVIMIGVGVYLYMTVKQSCTLTSGDCSAAYGPLVLCGAGLLYFLFLFCMRQRIELTAVLIEQSVNVVSTHPAIFVASAGLLVVKIGVVCLCLATYVTLFGSQVMVAPSSAGTGGCDLDWQVTHADEFMYAVVTVFLYWSVQLWLSMRFYVVSLTTGVWYYQNESLAAQEGSVGVDKVTSAPVCTSLKLAFTSSFGSIAFASLLIAICEYLKRLAQKERRNGGLIGCLIACCITCILNYLEFLTRFALVFHALTGDDFCTSGRTFLGHCSRHGFRVIMVDYLAAITLQFGAVILALLVTALTVLLVKAGVYVHGDDMTTVLSTYGAAAWFIGSLVLVFIAGILLNVVDAAYACLVLDLDNAAATGAYRQPAMAQAVIAKAHPTYVIQQPSGSAAIGQPVYADYPQGRGHAYAQQQAPPANRFYPNV